MWVKVAAIAALCVTDAVAQFVVRNQNCVTRGAGMLAYQFCGETVGPLDPPTTIYWNATVNNAIEFAFEAEAGAWRAVGFSDVAAMGPANVVFGCIPMGTAGFTPDATGADYALPASPDQRTPTPGAGNQNLQAWNQTIEGNLCTVTFRRPVDIGIVTQALGNRDQNVIAARGMPNTVTPGQHPNAGAMGRTTFTINFGNQMLPGTMMPTMPDATNAPAGGNGASTLSASMTLIPAIVGSIYVALW